MVFIGIKVQEFYLFKIFLNFSLETFLKIRSPQ